MSDRLSWGILGAGRIAGAFAKGLATSKTGTLLAVGSRDQAKADKFGADFGAPRRYGSYEALLADKDVQAVYVATPHPVHAEWAIKAAEAGKHILCEKPLTINHAEALAVIEAARRNDVFLMEAFMYRCNPQTAKLAELIREKVIGDVRVIQATFSFHAAFNPESRLLNQTLGGGGILDVGCYCTSMARLIAGVAVGRDFAEPVSVGGCGHIGPSRVDDYAVASLKFPGGILAQLATGVQLNQESVVRIFGSEGSILVPSPWFCARDGGATKIIVQRRGEKAPREIVVDSPAGIYSIEADTVAANIAKRQAPSPAMSWDDTLGNMRTLDQWRAAVGMIYDSEKPEANIATVDRRPLATRSGHTMKYGRIEGLDKPISRLVMGTMLEGSTLPLPHATVLFNEFFRAGGNAFDTAFIYAGGNSEKVLGQWVKNRGVRDQVVILAKGCHTPFCDPKGLTEQLTITLERLQTSYVDIYMMHRDNPEIPVGEFVDVLNEHKRLGRIRAFGGSNWPLERVKAANRYAKRKGLAGFSAVSNNFSLARMVEPVWAGCVASSEPAWRTWHKKTQTPVFAWSSQARGFFAGRARPDDKSDKELARCWYSDDNFKRLSRAAELAQMRGALPINIALAYVLCQPFPTYALIGPRTLTELSTSLPSLDVQLSANEIRWLNLET